MPKSVIGILITAGVILAVVWAYNYWSDDGIMKLGRNATGGPGSAKDK